MEWYGVPCNVGEGKLQYSFTMKDYYFFEFVVSNTRIPINGVSIYINGKWLDLARTHTNTWAYYRVRGCPPPLLNPNYGALLNHSREVHCARPKVCFDSL